MACSRKLRRRGTEDTCCCCSSQFMAGNVICASKDGTSVEELSFPSLVLYFSNWKNGN